MKSIYAFLLLLLIPLSSKAQVDCQYVNQGFEDWYDATSIYFEPGRRAQQSYLLPDNHIPLFRFITMAFCRWLFFLSREQKSTMLSGDWLWCFQELRRLQG